MHISPPQTSPTVYSTPEGEYDYVASSPYYRASFKGAQVRISVSGGWVEFNLREKRLKVGEEANSDISMSNKERTSFGKNLISVSKNKLFVSNIFEGNDLSYIAETSILQETLVLSQYEPLERIVSEISWDGLTPEFQEDGSILFSGGKPVLRIFPPTMTDALGNICNSLHYEQDTNCTR
ncbi:MAG: hypothetical protein HXS52_12705 [Theionarchaea archaeon]|nr:hypothetical protein [Theionarchaea archaeon]